MILSDSILRSLPRYPVVIVALFCFLVLISISELTTNDVSRLFVVPIRNTSIAIVFCTVVILFSLRKIHLKQLTAAGLYILLVVYGLLLSALNGAFELGAQGIFMNALVTLSGIVLITRPGNTVLPYRLSKYYLWYVLVALCMTIAIGGLDYNFPPHFVLEYSSNLDSRDILYSQGISQFFGYGALTAAYMLSKSDSAFRGLLLICVFLLLALSFLGGARGDSIASALVTLGYLAFQFRMRFFFSVLATGIVLILYVDEWSYFFDDFTIVQRLFDVVGGDYGYRDQLLIQVLNLLSLEPTCLLVGCGFGYFQYFYGFDFGLYPHNFIAESIIVFGFPVSAIFGLMVLDGARDYYRKNESMDLFLLFFTLSVLVAMKSGSLFGGWFFTASSLYFAAISYSKLTRNLVKKSSTESGSEI
jgi:hypothetical protein